MEFDHPGQKSLESSRVQNLVENNVSHAWKHVLDQVRVRRRRQVGVHGPFLLVRFALADKRIDNKVRGLLKVVQRSLQLWKRWMRIKGQKANFEGFDEGHLDLPIKLYTFQYNIHVIISIFL